jgi:hypothetical protein
MNHAQVTPNAHPLQTTAQLLVTVRPEFVPTVLLDKTNVTQVTLATSRPKISPKDSALPQRPTAVMLKPLPKTAL